MDKQAWQAGKGSEEVGMRRQVMERLLYQHHQHLYAYRQGRL